MACRLSRAWVLFVAVAGLGLLFGAETGPYPPTAKKPAVDRYHGTAVTDPYRWLEDRDDPAVKEWVDKQNKYSRAVLDGLPSREAILERVEAIAQPEADDYSDAYYQNGVLFAQVYGELVTLKSADDLDSEKPLVVPEEVLPKKEAAIDFYIPSLDAKHVAVSLSTEGSQYGTVHVFEVATAKKLPDQVPGVHTALGGSIAWNADGSGFYYTRYPQGNEKPEAEKHCHQHIYFHKLGTTASEDKYVFGKDLSPIATTFMETAQDGKHILATVFIGWASDQICHYLVNPAGEWKPLTRYGDQVMAATFGPKNEIFLLSFKDAPRGQLLRVPLDQPDLKNAQTVVPQGDAVLNSFLVTPNYLFVMEYRDGAARMRVFDRQWKEQKPVPLRPHSDVSEFLSLEGDELLFRNESYLEAPAWSRYDPKAEKVTPTKLAAKYPVDFSDCEVVRETAASKDGTKVPLTIVRRKGTKLDGQNPAYLNGYGGFGDIQKPNYLVYRKVWLEQGGIYAIAHLRGDGDFGTDWHRAGMLTRRQNSFDDFAACARHLIDRKYTRPERLAIEGGSNGGLLVGAAITQHPELFRAAVSYVGLYDMLRCEAHHSGATDILEYGTVTKPEEFRALHAYSPYHRVKDGTAYPAVLLVTGENDHRANPSDSWKFAARLQEATSSKRPVLVWTEPKQGHNVGSDVIDADAFAFLFSQLGVEYKPVKGR